jgi:hypothetical protein
MFVRKYPDTVCGKKVSPKVTGKKFAEKKNKTKD